VFIVPTDPHPTQHLGQPPTPDDVRGVLGGVIDPELHASIVDLGMVDDVRIGDGPDAGLVTVKVVLTTAGCPLRAQIKRDVQSKVLGLPGVETVKGRDDPGAEVGRDATRPLQRP
jgi:metal-sulfur cluster biosynthetic enzyme